MSLISQLLSTLDLNQLVTGLTIATALASPVTPTRITTQTPPLHEYIRSLLLSSRTRYETAICVPVYLSRIQGIMKGSPSSPCVPYQMFTACLILASKYVNDLVYANTAWSIHRSERGLENNRFGFTIDEINQMELELLHCLDWRLGISEHDLESITLPLFGYAKASIWTSSDIYCRDIRMKQDTRYQSFDMFGIQKLWQQPATKHSQAELTLVQPLSYGPSQPVYNH